MENKAADQERLLDSLMSDTSNSNKELRESLVALEKRAQFLESELEKMKQSVSAQEVSQTASSSSAADSTTLPYERRTIARMGGFTWNTPAADLVRIAKEVLSAGGIPDDNWKSLHAVRDPGSIVELELSTAAMLQSARLAVRCANRRIDQRLIWLDAAKTRDELAPARLVRRAAEALIELESNRPQSERKEVTKVLSGKQVKLGGQVVCYSANANLMWTEMAKERYDAPSLDMVKAWAEAS